MFGVKRCKVLCFLRGQRVLERSSVQWVIPGLILYKEEKRSSCMRWRAQASSELYGFPGYLGQTISLPALHDSVLVL